MTASLPNVEYTVNFADGPTANWQLLSFDCEEEIDGGARLSLELGTDLLEAEIADFLGTTCELLARRADHAHYFYGVVQRVDLLGRSEQYVRLAIHAISAFELAKQRRNSRIWQDVPTRDIVQEVLDEALGDYQRTVRIDAASRGQAPRSYCVQYRETDYDFVRRLLEEEGISYYFNHDPDAGHEVMVLCDANDQYPRAENIDISDEFPLIASNPQVAELESLHSFEWSQQLTTTAILRRDFDWLGPTEPLTSAAPGQDARGRIRRVYDHGQRRFELDDLQERAKDLVEASTSSANSARATSNALGLRPGLRFTTYACDSDGAPGEYVVRRVRHRGGSGNAGGLGGDAVHEYANELECVAATAVLRPLPTTPKPRVHGPQTATVVGSQEIHTDVHGRIQVQFHWEESPSFASNASCWVRCAQSWAGGGWGAQFIPRVGMEVVVEFLEGNPDRPLVTGCVYNGSNAPPFEVPSNSTQSGWRSNSSPGGGGSNELRFEDAAGAEQIYMHGQKDWCVDIVHDTARSTGNDETHAVGHDFSKTVGNNQSETVGVDKTIGVGSNHGERIGAAMSLTVGTDQTVTIGANQTVTIGASQSISVGAGRSETIATTATETVGVAKAVTVGAAYALTVGAAMNTAVGAASAEEVGGIKSVSVGGASSHSAGGSYSLDAASIRENAKGNLALEAGKDLLGKGKTKVVISSDGPFGAAAKTKFTIDAGDEFTVKCGSATFSMKKNGTIVIKGKKITIDGSDKVTIKGGKILEN